MNRLIRCAIGLLGSVFALFMYGAPTGTFRKVIQKRTTGDMSGIPYAIGLFNCLVYTLYGSPLISNGWDNVLVMGINLIGLLLECCFVAIYFFFAPPKSKKTMGTMVAAVFMVFGSMATISMWGIHDHSHKKLLVGSTSMVATVILYGSPLSDIRMVVRSKSVEFISFYFSLFAFLGCVLWLVYGALSHDIVIMAPNFLGIPLASVQMIIYCVYSHHCDKKKRGEVEIEDGKLCDIHLQLELERVVNKSETQNTTKCTNFASAGRDIEMQLET